MSGNRLCIFIDDVACSAMLVGIGMNGGGTANAPITRRSSVISLYRGAGVERVFATTFPLAKDGVRDRLKQRWVEGVRSVGLLEAGGNDAAPQPLTPEQLAEGAGPALDANQGAAGNAAPEAVVQEPEADGALPGSESDLAVYLLSLIESMRAAVPFGKYCVEIFVAVPCLGKSEKRFQDSLKAVESALGVRCCFFDAHDLAAKVCKDQLPNGTQFGVLSRWRVFWVLDVLNDEEGKFKSIKTGGSVKVPANGWKAIGQGNHSTISPFVYDVISGFAAIGHSASDPELEPVSAMNHATGLAPGGSYGGIFQNRYVDDCPVRLVLNKLARINLAADESNETNKPWWVLCLEQQNDPTEEIEEIYPPLSVRVLTSNRIDVRVRLAYEDEVRTLQVECPLWGDPNDTGFSVEISTGPTGEIALCGRAGERIVPLSISPSPEESGGCFRLTDDGSYLLTLDSKHFQECEYRRRLKEVLASGIHHVGLHASGSEDNRRGGQR